MNDYEGYYYEAQPKKKPEKRKSVRTFLAAALTIVISAGTLGFGIGVGGAFYEGLSARGQVDVAVVPSSPVSDLIVPVISDIRNTQAASMALTPESTVVRVIREVSDSVVSINTTAVHRDFFNRPRIIPGAGSGIISAEDDYYIYIITNYHVIENAESVEISIDDYISVSALPVGSDREADIAVIRVSKDDLHSAGVTNYKIAVFGDASKIEIGQTVIAMGNAMGEGQSATLGIVSAKGRKVPTGNNVFVETIQTDAAINGGNSGGALVNLRGEVIGVNTAKLAGVGIEGIGFAIPSNSVKEIFTEIMERSSVQRPFLGIAGVTITEYLMERNSLPTLGAFVSEVSRDSGAADAGMRSGDIITSFAGTSILTMDQILELIPQQAIGSFVDVTIVRLIGGDSQEITLSVEIRDANAARSF